MCEVSLDLTGKGFVPDVKERGDTEGLRVWVSSRESSRVTGHPGSNHTRRRERIFEKNELFNDLEVFFLKIYSGFGVLFRLLSLDHKTVSKTHPGRFRLPGPPQRSQVTDLMRF